MGKELRHRHDDDVEFSTILGTGAGIMAILCTIGYFIGTYVTPQAPLYERVIMGTLAGIAGLFVLSVTATLSFIFMMMLGYAGQAAVKAVHDPLYDKIETIKAKRERLKAQNGEVSVHRGNR
jgi:hypothetical protein